MKLFYELFILAALSLYSIFTIWLLGRWVFERAKEKSFDWHK